MKWIKWELKKREEMIIESKVLDFEIKLKECKVKRSSYELKVLDFEIKLKEMQREEIVINWILYWILRSNWRKGYELKVFDFEIELKE